MMVQGESTIHQHYAPIAWAKGLVYFSIPSMRSSEDVLKIMDSNSIIKGLIMEEPC
jgi:hypothetical protein